MNVKYRYSCAVASIILMLGVTASTSNTNGYLFDKSKQKTDKIDQNSFKPIIDSVEIYKFKEKLGALQPRALDAIRTPDGVRYTFAGGESVERCGGTIAWRNNNPGCIRYSSNAVKMGAIGKANNFAIFPNEETGMRAIKTLLLSDSYRDLNIIDAITRYAPPHENNTEHYIQSVCRIVGLPRTAKICDLDDEKLDKVVKTIRRLEGWVVGTEKIKSETKIADDFADAKSHLNRATERLNCYVLGNAI